MVPDSLKESDAKQLSHKFPPHENYLLLCHRDTLDSLSCPPMATSHLQMDPNWSNIEIMYASDLLMKCLLEQKNSVEYWLIGVRNMIVVVTNWMSTEQQQVCDSQKNTVWWKVSTDWMDTDWMYDCKRSRVWLIMIDKSQQQTNHHCQLCARVCEAGWLNEWMSVLSKWLKLPSLEDGLIQWLWSLSTEKHKHKMRWCDWAPVLLAGQAI